MIDMTYWCESCARKNNCYTIRNRPKCFTPITSNDRTADHKTEPQRDVEKIVWHKDYGWIEDEPQTDIGTSDTVYSDTAGYVPRVDMTDCSWK